MARVISAVHAVHVAQEVKRYVVDLVGATRQSPELRLGASPRATLQLLRVARAWAALELRDFVIPDDVQALAVPVLAHRLVPTPDALLGRRTPERIVADLLGRVPVAAGPRR
jgi:MoxR-like ATPase